MNRLVVAVAIAMVLGLSSVAVVPVAAASTAMPTWAAGDFWVYAMTGTGGGTTVPSLGSGSTIRYDVVGPDTTTIGGSSIATYHTRVNYSVKIPTFSQNLYLNGDEWFRQSDLAPAKLSISTSVLGLTATITATYSPPPDIHWPLTAGASWSVTTTISLVADFFGNTNSSTATESVTQTVLADQNITVTAGTFQTTPVKQTIGASGEYTISYWSSTAGNTASQRSYYSNGTQAGSMDLQSYSYGAGGGFSLSTVVAGLPLYAWIAIIVIVVVVIAAVALLRRKKPAPPMMPPPGAMPPGPGPGQPPMQPPMQPPQAPPPQP